MALPRVLFVDDDENRKHEFEKHIKSLCEEIVWANTAIKGIELLRENEFDLIFLDHDMGLGLNGLDVTCCLYRSKNVRATIVIHTINIPASFSMEKVLLDMGMNALRISFCKEDFFEVVKQLIRDSL